MISVVTVTFNRAKQLYWGLRSVASKNSDIEFVVVDDGGEDNTKGMVDRLVKEFPQNAYKYWNTGVKEHRISSIPRNDGFERSEGDIVVFTESECLHLHDTIGQVIQGVHQDTVPLATQVWSMGKNIWEKLDKSKELKRPESLTRHRYAMLTEGNVQNTNAPDADWAITGSLNCYVGCLFGVKRKWFEDIGGFDEDFEGHGGEDWDLLDRLDLYGKRVVKRNDIAVIHQWHEKNYPYNIYDMAEKNLKKSRERLDKGIYRANG